ncbi:Crp/Fnr family transcriptional regulator [Bradyrhizobium sp. Leo170]|uniref:Crp/Fnr family transcriptional regulator n=1 Tax=Bradyrhizobium sp. Leo170 TaxID=1571199 RepID=UPI00102E47C5|nr:Crp/Fnr family transcriptional regulator [Bradyrhizobium sp. Leo170]TAI66369.1 Crp/Fnr family transcriptional regulator [Bradyrhizobium sp. Leo170]
MADELGEAYPGNRLLRALMLARLESILPHLEPVNLRQHQVLFRAGAPIDHLYFIDRGLVSRVKAMEDGRVVEIGAVGNEGVVGLFAIHGIRGAMWEYAVRIPGMALRIDRDTFERKITQAGEASALLRRYSSLVVDAFSQIAACNRLHSLRQRCCHWLLVAHDSAGSDSFPLTHELLALTLGVQRSGVSIAANSLQKAGLIHYRHGRVNILGRARLETEACECYAATRRQFDALFTDTRRTRRTARQFAVVSARIG